MKKHTIKKDAHKRKMPTNSFSSKYNVDNKDQTMLCLYLCTYIFIYI